MHAFHFHHVFRKNTIFASDVTFCCILGAIHAQSDVAKSFECFVHHKITNSNLVRRAKWQCRRFCAATNEKPPRFAETTNARFILRAESSSNRPTRAVRQEPSLNWPIAPTLAITHNYGLDASLPSQKKWHEPKWLSRLGCGTSDAAANSRDVFRSGVPRQQSPYQLLISPPLICLAG